MAVPEYTKRAINNYNNKFDRITINLPKGTKEKYKSLGLEKSLTKLAQDATIEKLADLDGFEK